MKHLRLYEETPAQKKNREEKELAELLLNVLKDNGYTIYWKYYSNNNFKIEIGMPSSEEIGEIAQYYLSLLGLLKEFNVKITEDVYDNKKRLNILFSEKTWEELKKLQETSKYNL